MNGAAEPLDQTGNAGSAIGVAASAARRRSAAGSISGEWNAPATSSFIARAPASSRASSAALSTSSSGPLKTTCPGALSFATVRPRLRASSATAWESPPSIATIPPGCAAAASCIAAARSSTRRSASSNVSAPAACSAAYSPSECPAAATSWPLSCASQAHAQTRKIAGCCTRVPMPRSANGSYPRSSSPRSNSGVPRHAASMSAAWLPCPGKRSAEPAMHVIPHQEARSVAQVRQTCGKCRTDERCRWASDLALRPTNRPMPRISNLRLGARLAVAFGLIALALALVSVVAFVEALDPQLRGQDLGKGADARALRAPTRSAGTSRTSPTRPPHTCTSTMATSRRRTAWRPTSARSRRRTPRTSRRSCRSRGRRRRARHRAAQARLRPYIARVNLCRGRVARRDSQGAEDRGASRGMYEQQVARRWIRRGQRPEARACPAGAGRRPRRPRGVGRGLGQDPDRDHRARRAGARRRLSPC